MILYDITLILSNEFMKKNKKTGLSKKTVKHFWQTHGVGECYDNLMEILTNQYSKSEFPDTPNDLVKHELTYNNIQITVMLVKPH